jgi:hypothetical protein
VKFYVHKSRGRRGREIDNATARFVEDTRMGGADEAASIDVTSRQTPA